MGGKRKLRQPRNDEKPKKKAVQESSSDKKQKLLDSMKELG